MSNRYQPLVALVLATSLLAGCGAKLTVPPAAAMAAAATTRAADIANAADTKAAALIKSYQAVSDADPNAQTERDTLIMSLGLTNSDAAASFLMNIFENADNMPAAQKSDIQQTIANSLVNLDTYDDSADTAVIAAGPGDTPQSEDLYQAAQARKTRHFSIMRFLTAPLHWADVAIKWLYNFLNGHSSHKSAGGGKKPAPAPASGADPSAPADGSSGVPTGASTLPTVPATS